jgi:hypothetical protein
MIQYQMTETDLISIHLMKHISIHRSGLCDFIVGKTP